MNRRRRRDPAEVAHNAAIDAAAEWLHAWARKLRGQPVIGGVLADQLADEIEALRKRPRPDAAGR